VGVLEFSCALGGGGRLWIGARPAGASPGAATGLLPLERSMVRHCFRLVGGGAQPARAGPPRRERRSAIRQIERERQRLGPGFAHRSGQMLAAIRLQLEAVTEQLVPLRAGSAGARADFHADPRRPRPGACALPPPASAGVATPDLESAVEQLWSLSGIPARFEASLSLEPLPRSRGWN